MICSNVGTSMFSRGRLLAGTSGIAALALAMVLTSGCSNAPAVVEGSGPGSGVVNPGQSAAAPGAVSVALVVPPKAQINTVSYQLTNTGFSQSGTLNVAQSGAVLAVIGGIPAGTGYTLALTASDVGQKFTSCAGSSMVAVTGGSTTPVSVNIECRLPAQSVPIPMPAVVLLAVALLAAGATATRHRGRRARNRPSDAPPSGKNS
jgi:hypothetical protein